MEGIWSSSRKGLLMSYGYCGTTGHNIRKYPLVKGKHTNLFQDEETSQTMEDVQMKTPQDIEDAKISFTPTLGLFQSYGQPSTQPSGQSFNIQSQPFLFIDDEEEPESILRPKVIFEARKPQQRKLLQQSIGIRKIDFNGDETGVNVPTKLSYSPRKSHLER
ncbi:hypothetical protein HAX54_044543 [Datura stramonium]|uniref:Uncharacterized protein n=1 Tax=Datura stramonium TaxID=4076 RepID=A0ABS8SP96_DATST|nr:hypothetical protein [Datura stramonium]